MKLLVCRYTKFGTETPYLPTRTLAFFKKNKKAKWKFSKCVILCPVLHLKSCSRALRNYAKQRIRQPKQSLVFCAGAEQPAPHSALAGQVAGRFLTRLPCVLRDRPYTVKNSGVDGGTFECMTQLMLTDHPEL